MKFICVIMLLSIVAAVRATAEDESPVFNSTTPKIITEEMAEIVAISASTNTTNYSITSNETAKAVNFFYVYEEKKGIAEKGDRFWKVHFILKGSQLITKIAWVNADTEQVIFFFPEEEIKLGGD